MQLPVIPLVAILIFTVPADGHIDFDPKHTQEGGTCLHDKFQAKNLPYIQRKADKPFKREDTKYAPIRVHTVVDDSVTKFPEFAIIGDSNGPLFSAINVLSHALLGRRIPGNFTLPPACDEIEDGPNKGKCYSGTVSNDSFLCPELEGSLLLGMSTHFLGTREACRNETGPCQMEGPNGYGDDIDYFLQVVSFEAFCSPGAIAAALACAQDDFHRPAFGIIFICPSNFRTLITYEQQFNVLIHELTHAFGFSDNLFDSFHDGELNFYNATDIFEYNGEPILGLTSPKLLEVAREYFDCPNLEYVPLENGGGSGSANSHWEARVLTHEIMGAFIIEDYQVYSNFTWALFEDSGWYKVNYTVTSQLSARQFNLTWGRGLGCGFVLQSCNNPQTYPYLCDVTEGYRQCTPDLLTKSICPSSSRFYDGCMVPAIADATDTCLSFVNISGGPLLQTQDTRSRCFRFTTNQCDYEPICLTVTIVKEPQSGLLAYYVTISGTDVWCRENEVIEHRGLFLECPPITTLLLHYDRHTIITPNQIPPPLCHKSCATCSAVNVSDKCLTCNEGQSLQGPPPSSCAGRINSTGQEQGCVCQRGQVQLLPGVFIRAVVVCINNQHTAICANNWDARDAAVVCRHFRLFGGFPFVINIPASPSLLSNPRCIGNETNLLSCEINDDSNCNDTEKAGIYCFPFPDFCTHGDVRITNFGIEICINDVWGSICSENFNEIEATVFCKQLGFPNGISLNSTYRYTSLNYGQFKCNGTESSLLECSIVTIGDCIPAAVRCYDFPCNHGDVRLVDGRNQSHGRVEVCVLDVWGTVCDDSWDDKDARVVCRQLGYPFGRSVGNNVKSGSLFQPIYLDDVNCNGTETSLLNCPHNGIGQHNCGHFEDAGVVCLDVISCNHGDLRLVDGRNQSHGRVEICVLDIWGTVCDDSWNDRDARVVCRQLGYHYGWSDNSVKSGNQSQPIYLDDVNCIGTETSLLHCSHNGIGQHNCRHFEDVGVVCSDLIPCNYGDVRLVDGNNKFHGRVEVCALDVWGTVCENSWDDRDAQVVCRQLGYHCKYIGTVMFN